MDKTCIPITNENLQDDENPPQYSKEEKAIGTEKNNTTQDTQTQEGETTGSIDE
jgi:hypothetical protein